MSKFLETLEEQIKEFGTLEDTSRFDDAILIKSYEMGSKTKALITKKDDIIQTVLFFNE